MKIRLKRYLNFYPFELLYVKDEWSTPKAKIEKRKKKMRTLSEDPEGLTNYTLPKAKFEPGEFKFIVLSGNYPQSVREMLKVRMNWKEMEDENEAIEQAHFMWRPCNYGLMGFDKLTKRKKNFDFPLVFNHFEYIRWICTKTGLIKSLTKYYENNPDAVAAKYRYVIF
jgi:hypothetical protein